MRARARVKGGGLLIQGLVSDVTKHEETAARLAEADDRFMHLLDVIGEHVYRAIVHPDGRIEELFQGPGADRLLGGADPDSGMENWNGGDPPGRPARRSTPSRRRWPRAATPTSSTACAATTASRAGSTTAP